MTIHGLQTTSDSIKAALFCFAAILFMPGEANANDGVDRFHMPWIVEDGDPPFGTRTVAPKMDITGARLLPLRLFVVQNDVTDPTGKVVAPAGTELGIVSSRAFAACTLRAPKTKGSDAIAFMGASRYLCFVDQNKDGNFDYYFGMATPMSGVLAGRGKIGPAKPQNTVKGASYLEIDPALSKAAVRISIRYGSSQWFLSCIEGSSDYDTSCFGPRVQGRSKQFPHRFSVLGAEFETQTANGKELSVTMTKAIPRQPLLLLY